MRVKRPFVNWPALVLAMGFLAFFTYHSAAIRHMALTEPAVVVTVDLESLFNQLDERQGADEQLQRMAEELQSESDDMSARIRELEEELEIYEPGSEKHQEIMEQLSLITLEYQAFAEFSRQKIEAEKSLTLKRIYDGIRRAGRSEAEERGYDIILVNDSLGQLPPGDEVETIRQISSRRMLYSNPRLDITSDLVNRMNRDFHQN